MDHTPGQDLPTPPNGIFEKPFGEDTPGRTLFFGPYGLRAGWSLLIFLFIVFLLVLVGGGIYTRLHPHVATTVVAKAQQKPVSAAVAQETLPHQILSSHGIPLVVLVLASWILSFVEHRRFGVFGFGGIGRFSDCVKGLVTGIVTLSLLIAVLHMTHLLVFDGFALSGTPAIFYGLKWFAAFCLVGITEEYMFRGYLQYTLARGLSGILPHGNAYRNRLGFWLAAALLSGLFFWGHTANPGESPFGLLSVFLVGLVLAYSLWRTGSLWWAIGFHATWDWAQSYLYGVRDSGTISKGRLLNTHPVGNPLFSGGLTGPEGSIFILGILAILVVLIRTTLPKREQPTLYPLDLPAGLPPSHLNEATTVL